VAEVPKENKNVRNEPVDGALFRVSRSEFRVGVDTCTSRGYFECCFMPEVPIIPPSTGKREAMRKSSIHTRSRVWLLTAAMLAGCSEQEWKWDWWNKPQATTRPAGTMNNLASFSPQRKSPAIEGTIGSVTYLQGTRLLRVRGFGVVIGLGGKGSRNVRPGVKEQVIADLRRYHSANPHTTRDMPTAEKQLDSLDAAVVEVLAEIPAGATKNQRFDVFIRADDSGTQSLAGGYLIPCDLRIYQEVSAAEGIEGRIHASTAGPVFINPFTSSGSATTVNLREGYVIGGGVNKVDRRLSLVALIESYATVRQIQDSINSRFKGEEKVADATSAANVELTLPPPFRNRRAYFLDLVMHLPLSSSPVNREARCKALVGELARPDAPLEDAALALEGLGGTVISMLQPLYTDSRRQVNYYAARTGLRLGDELAIEVIIRHARDERSPYRLPAIRELGDCSMAARAGTALRELLTNSDARIRILAYESLRKVEPDSVSRYVVGQRPENFIMEVVPSDGPAMIYARRTEVRRIAFIGGDRMMFRPPLLYSQPGQPVTISGKAGEPTITVLRKNVEGKNIGPKKVPLSVAPLVRFLGNDLRTTPDGRIEGLGVDYAIILDMLYRFCEKGGINADMRWEEPTVEELVGPLKPMGRPESEL